MHYRSIHLLVYFGIASLSYFLINHLDELPNLFTWYDNLLDRQQGLVQNGLAVLVVSGIALLFQASADISRIFIENLPISGWLRHVLSGKDFIEGDWPLVVVYGEKSPEPGRLLYIGFLSIEFKHDELYVYGEDWTPDGRHAVCFRSVRSSFHADQHERRLEYFYRQGQNWQDESMRGYTEIYFFPKHTVSNLHAGEFRDTEHNDVRFYARKKNYRLFQKRLKTPEQKKAAANEVWAEFQPQIKTMIAHRVSTDWK
jgi:hypothetical protein